ncbi:MAG TPA: ArsB/NhaD family transporter [Xanthobacteraceae bacterium]|nr:ArsB/NhaD family transporter [Xanthobacteraceae bacterium]
MSEPFVPHVLFGLSPRWVSATVLALTYAVIISGRLNRAVVALIGASFIVMIGGLDQNEAIAGINWDTIGLLTGMMVLVSISRRSGMFQYLAVWSAQKAKASPAGILVMLQLTTAVVSALLNNVSTVLLVAPVTLAITEELDVPPFPFLFAEIFASNIGGTATLIGDPPNILIGSSAGLDFNAFLVNLAPVVLVVFAVQLLMVHLVWGRKLKASPESRALVMGMNAPGLIADPVLLRQSVAVMGLVLIAFIFGGPLHLRPATIALAGAAALMLLDNWQHQDAKQSENVHRTFADVEWITIFFFIALFVLVHAVEVSGLLDVLAGRLVAATGDNIAHAGTAILWMSAGLSAILDNIPFVATMIPLIKNMAPAYGGLAHVEPLWWCLALGACLGGNGTLVGAAANLTVVGVAERNAVRISFVEYLVYGLPMMLVSIAICQLYVWLRYF